MEQPDLSHLTKEEQEQILAVIKRQKDEEEKERAMTRYLQLIAFVVIALYCL